MLQIKAMASATQQTKSYLTFKYHCCLSPNFDWICGIQEDFQKDAADCIFSRVIRDYTPLCRFVSWSVDWSPFWAAAPKGRCPVEHRGEFPYVRPSVRPSVRPPPGWPQIRSPSPQICPPSPQFSPPGLKSAFQASNQPPHLKSVLQTSNLPSRPSISPPSIKSALHGLNLPSKTQIGSPSLDSALQPSNMPSAV